jgi:hypothetical protein
MRQNKKLSDLINGIPQKRKIRDYAKIDYIFRLYLMEYYDTMSREIYWSKAGDTWCEMKVYLENHFKYELGKEFIINDMIELYTDRIDSVLYEIELKKELKRLRL